MFLRVRGHGNQWRFAQGSLVIPEICVPAKVDMWWDSSNEPYCLIDSHYKYQNYTYIVSLLWMNRGSCFWSGMLIWGFYRISGRRLPIDWFLGVWGCTERARGLPGAHQNVEEYQKSKKKILTDYVQWEEWWVNTIPILPFTIFFQKINFVSITGYVINTLKCKH